MKIKKLYIGLSIVVILLLVLNFVVIGNKMDNKKGSLDIGNNEEKYEEQEQQDMNQGNPIAVFETSMGEFRVELFKDKMPTTVNNFKKLAEDGFYDETKFHRVIQNFMIQGGDPLSKDESKKALWGTGGADETIKDEFVKGLSNVKGTIAMANSGPNTGSSQFFINLADNTYLDYDKEPSSSKHPVFGKVISGMEVVESIGNAMTDQYDKPQDDVTVYSVKIIYY